MRNSLSVDSVSSSVCWGRAPLLIVGLAALLPFTAPAAELTVSASTPARATGNVIIGGLSPNAGDTLVWSENTPAQDVTPLNADLRISGIRVDSPATKITFDGSHKVTLGLAGLDLGNATQDLEFQGNVNLELAQTWSVADDRQIRVRGALHRSPGVTLDFRLGDNSDVHLPGTTPGDLLVDRGAPYATYNGFDFAAVDAQGHIAPGSTVIPYTPNQPVVPAMSGTYPVLDIVNGDNPEAYGVRLPKSLMLTRGLRFNTPHQTNGQWLVKFSNGSALGAGSILVTPNVGTQDVVFDGKGAVRAAGGELVVQQFNPAGNLIINVPVDDYQKHPTPVVKNGPGAMVLNADSHYTGVTIINQGTLTINGDNGRAAGNFVVSYGATLAGSGVIGGDTRVQNTAILVPQQMSFYRPLNLKGGTLFLLDGPPPATLPGLLEVSYSGGLTYGGPVMVNFASLLAPGTYIYHLFDFVGRAYGSPSAVVIAGKYATGLTNSAGIWTGQAGGFTFSFSEASGALTVTSTGEIPPASRVSAVRYDRWRNLPGAYINALTDSELFPFHPTVSSTLSALELVPTADSNYAARLRGCLLPPVDGYFTFWISGDSSSELWLSNTTLPFQRTRIAYTNLPTAFRQFDAQSIQQSAPIFLEAGKQYYFEVLHKHETGSGHVSVFWQIPGQRRDLVRAPYLAFAPTAPGDTHGDGIPDSWKSSMGLDVTMAYGDNGAYGDPDGDGLNNLLEYQFGTNPLKPDTDGDGFSDGVEVFAGTNPLDPNSKPLPMAPWSYSQVGNTNGAGLAAHLPDGTFKMAGDADGIPARPLSGDQKDAAAQAIVDNGDSLHLIGQTMSGDFDLITEVTPMNGTAGSGALVIRATGDSKTATAVLEMDVTGTYTFYARRSATANAYVVAQVSPANLPLPANGRWLKLRRQAGVVSAYSSPDGQVWDLIQQAGLSLGNSCLAGLGVWGPGSNPPTRQFSSVTIQPLDDSNLAASGINATTTSGTGDSFFNPPGADLANLQVIQSLTGASARTDIGTWVQQGGAVYNTSSAGAVDFPLTVPAAGIYRLTVTGTPWHNTTVNTLWNARVEIDGYPAGAMQFNLATGETGTAYFYTPWLAAGTHVLQVYLDNVSISRQFAFTQVNLEWIPGTDANDDGIPDWMRTMLSAENTSLAPVVVSAVSPYCLEGSTPFLNALAVTANQSPVTVLGGVGDGWYANIPLDKANPVTVAVSAENGGMKSQGTIAWTPTDLIASAGDNIRIRKGDSLLITVASAGSKQPTKITVTDPGATLTTLTLPAGKGKPVEFSNAGVYSLAVSGTRYVPVTVEVISASFAKPDPEAEVGYFRDWINPDLPATGVVITADSRLELDPEPTPDGRGQAFSLSIDAAAPRVVLARVDDGTSQGAILDRAVVTGVSIASGDRTGIYYVKQNVDGSHLVEMVIQLSSVPPGLRVKVTSFAAGVLFANGQTVMWLTAADFNKFGQAKIRFLMAAGVKSSTCNRIQVYQGKILLTGPKN